MFSEKHEFQASISTTLGVNLSPRGDIQAGYAITEHLGVTMNYALSSFEERLSTVTNHVGEFGLGYFINTTNDWCYEIYSGFGFGMGQNLVRDYYAPSSGTVSLTDARFTKFFIQPSMGMNKGPMIWGISFKLSHVDLKSKVIEDGGIHIRSAQSAYFFEPVAQWTTPLRKKQLFSTFKAGLNLTVGAESDLFSDLFICSAGLVIKLNGKKGK